MRTHTVTADPGMTVGDAVDLMDLYQVNLLPVIGDTGILLGVVTEHDVAEALLPALSGADADGAAPVRQAGEASRRPLVDIMTSPAICVDERDEIVEAASLMLSRNLKRLPVTSEGKLVGIIGRAEVCQAVLGDHGP